MLSVYSDEVSDSDDSDSDEDTSGAMRNKQDSEDESVSDSASDDDDENVGDNNTRTEGQGDTSPPNTTTVEMVTDERDCEEQDAILKQISLDADKIKTALEQLAHIFQTTSKEIDEFNAKLKTVTTNMNELARTSQSTAVKNIFTQLTQTGDHLNHVVTGTAGLHELVNSAIKNAAKIYTQSKQADGSP